jgi:hypothetical protein
MLWALIRLFEKNKILSTLWAIYTAAFFFLVHEGYTSDQQIAALRTSAIQVEQKQEEYGIAENAVA